MTNKLFCAEHCVSSTSHYQIDMLFLVGIVWNGLHQMTVFLQSVLPVSCDWISKYTHRLF